MFYTIYVKTGHIILRSRGTTLKALMTKVMFNFQYHKGIIRSESIIIGMNLLNTFCTLYLASAAALNEFKYFLP